jgi:hypothetical protein
MRHSPAITAPDDRKVNQVQPVQCHTAARMDQKLRQACDTCHARKIKCTSDGSGACAFCKSNRSSCTFSPRDTMGRPRKPSKETKGRRASSKHSPRNSHSPEVRGRSSEPMPRPLPSFHPTGVPLQVLDMSCSTPHGFDSGR